MTKWDKKYLQLAKFVSEWSKDPSTKVGAVIVRPNNSVVSIGYNGFAKKVLDSADRYENRELKYKLIVHSEMNAIAFANESLEGCTLYVYPFMPCPTCAGIVIQNGITRVVAPLNDNERWVESFELTKAQFNEAKVSLTLVDSGEFGV